MMKVPVRIYADFECYLPKCVEKRGKNTEYQCKHKPSGYGLCVVSDNEDTFPSFYENETFDGDVGQAFVKRLIQIRNEIESIPAINVIYGGG